jgi:hypothetical protein
MNDKNIKLVVPNADGAIKGSNLPTPMAMAPTPVVPVQVDTPPIAKPQTSDNTPITDPSPMPQSDSFNATE